MIIGVKTMLNLGTCMSLAFDYPLPKLR